MCRMRMHSITTDPHTRTAVVFKYPQPIVFKCNVIVLRLALNGILCAQVLCDDEHGQQRKYGPAQAIGLFLVHGILLVVGSAINVISSAVFVDGSRLTAKASPY